jgi:hypothetical protein
MRRHAEEHAGHCLAADHRDHAPGGTTDDDRTEAFDQQQAHDITPLGADCQAQADLARPLADVGGGGTVDSDRGKDDRQGGQRHRERGDDPGQPKFALESVGDRLNAGGRCWTHTPHRSGNGSHQGVGVPGRSHQHPRSSRATRAERLVNGCGAHIP